MRASRYSREKRVSLLIWLYSKSTLEFGSYTCRHSASLKGHTLFSYPVQGISPDLTDFQTLHQPKLNLLEPQENTRRSVCPEEYAPRNLEARITTNVLKRFLDETPF